MLFSEIPGNTTIKKQLINSVKNNRVSHAQLFSGKDGCAKLSLALAYARYLNCNNRTDEDSCGVCSCCIKYQNLSHPDLLLIFPVFKNRTDKLAISDNFVEKWRDFILKNPYQSLNSWTNNINIEKKSVEKVSIYKDEVLSLHKKLALKNFEALNRVVLIWMPELMSNDTPNKLLKLFEEPPKGTIFLLVSESPNLLLPTIRSRFQDVQVKNFSSDEANMALKKINVSIEKINQLKSIAGASLSEMIKLLDDDINSKILFNDLSSWLRLIYKTDIVNISNWVESISLNGRRAQKLFLSYTIKMIRECLIFNFANKDLLKVNDKELEFISKFAPFIHEDNCILIIEELEKAIKSINRNANSKILFFELSLKMVKFIKAKRIYAIN